MLHKLIKKCDLALELSADQVYREWYLQYRKRLEPFRNKHSGERCFIIGNGPSLNRMDLSLLKDCTCFGLNKIYMIFERAGLKIDYHVAVNPLVIQQGADDFAKIGCPSFLAYHASRGVVDDFADANYLMTSSYRPAPYTFTPDITFPLHEGYTVTYVAMQIAFYMGFSEVYLIGVDHNFSVSGQPNEKQVLGGEDVNHFDPDYFKGQEWHLPDLEASELSYSMARFFYNRAQRKIFDATLDGKLKIFPKISYQDALARCSMS
jgi:hypothetical protein